MKNPIGIIGKGPTLSPVKCKGKFFDSYVLQSFTHPYLTELFSLWYKKVGNRNIKIVPINIKELLTPIALTYWIVGDGSYDKNRGSLIICTDSFTIFEVEELRTVLLDKFNIVSTRVLSGSGPNAYRIRISSKEIHKVQSLVEPHIPDMMKYRIGL
jgi:hypothetical protein